MGNLPWATPTPGTETGLKSDMVYGQNFGTTLGVYHTVTLGSRVQVALNPLAAFAELGAAPSAALTDFWGAGSGMAGNLQMIVGTDTRINWGTQFKITLGGEESKYLPKKSVLPKLICALIAAACIIYPIVYTLSDNDDWRANAAIIFQVTLDILLATMVTLVFYQGERTDNKTKLYAEVLKEATQGKTKLQKLELGLKGLAVILGITGVALAPPILAAITENHFNPIDPAEYGL